MKTAKLGDLKSPKSAWAPWACPTATPAPAPTTPNRSAPSTAPDLGVTLSTPPRSTARTQRGTGRPALKGRRDEVVLATKFGLSRTPARPGTSTAARPTSAPPSKAPASTWAPTTSTCTTNTGSTRIRRSRTRSARSPNWSPRARSATSACPKRGSTPSAAPTPSTRSPRCSRSTRCGPATRNPRCCRCCASWASGWCPTPRWATVPHRHHPPRPTFDDVDFRATNPRFTGETSSATCASPTRSGGRRRRRRHPGAGRAGLAADQGRRHRAIPGTSASAAVEENVAADDVVLTAEQLTAGRPHSRRRVAITTRRRCR